MKKILIFVLLIIIAAFMLWSCTAPVGKEASITLVLKGAYEKVSSFSKGFESDVHWDLLHVRIKKGGEIQTVNPDLMLKKVIGGETIFETDYPAPGFIMQEIPKLLPPGEYFVEVFGIDTLGDGENENDKIRFFGIQVIVLEDGKNYIELQTEFTRGRIIFMKDFMTLSDARYGIGLYLPSDNERYIEEEVTERMTDQSTSLVKTYFVYPGTWEAEFHVNNLYNGVPFPFNFNDPNNGIGHLAGIYVLPSEELIINLIENEMGNIRMQITNVKLPYIPEVYRIHMEYFAGMSDGFNYGLKINWRMDDSVNTEFIIYRGYKRLYENSVYPIPNNLFETIDPTAIPGKQYKYGIVAIKTINLDTGEKLESGRKDTLIRVPFPQINDQMKGYLYNEFAQSLKVFWYYPPEVKFKILDINDNPINDLLIEYNAETSEYYFVINNVLPEDQNTFKIIPFNDDPGLSYLEGLPAIIETIAVGGAFN